MIGVLLGLAAMGMTPEPLNLKKWLAADDYPSAGELRGGPGGARIEVVVDDAGTPLRCDVVASTGSSSLDQRACQFARLHARFRTARDEAGHPVAGVYAQAVDRRPAVTPWVDMTLSVDRMPDARAAVVQLRLVLDPAGKVETCEVATPSGAPALDRLACPSLATAALPPVRDGAGVAIRALRPTSVGFVATRSASR